MPLFSANLGFLWQELPLPDAIRAAKAAGFDAVECHYPYEVPVEAVRTALSETGLLMLGLNTIRGNVAAGDNGLAAVPQREAEARVAIEQAIGYAQAIGAPNVHVMAGRAAGEAARTTFIATLRHACALAAKAGITILIEPLNHRDAPGYFLQTSEQALEIIEAVGAPNIKLMFDCYHLQIMQGDLTRRLQTYLNSIGHIQIASVPDRREPDHGEIDYRYILRLLEELGYERPIGAEYRPATSTEAGLQWLQEYR
ncbi:hydroxypyruvate isomerase family protein [Xaviernesmea oryzae]|uniref:Hydroxypyruvate isomerase n=1 Tax=Xaviernesmea oryzae TaxID=464029 RepID=A0A1X7FUL5_9HYPH|nr:TIM barrel protein [Xaviernesmea oryzae]SMF59045.1 hydroxypyruvate isomerase [Xaviernesmea oryzae]